MNTKNLVPKKRLELSRTFVHNDLNVACLPFHHLGLVLLGGIEPPTSSLPMKRDYHCATAAKTWCPERDLNPHTFWVPDFESGASTDFTIGALNWARDCYTPYGRRCPFCFHRIVIYDGSADDTACVCAGVQPKLYPSILSETETEAYQSTVTTKSTIEVSVTILNLGKQWACQVHFNTTAYNETFGSLSA